MEAGLVAESAGGADGESAPIAMESFERVLEPVRRGLSLSNMRPRLRDAKSEKSSILISMGWQEANPCDVRSAEMVPVHYFDAEFFSLDGGRMYGQAMSGAKRMRRRLLPILASSALMTSFSQSGPELLVGR